MWGMKPELLDWLDRTKVVVDEALVALERAKAFLCREDPDED